MNFRVMLVSVAISLNALTAMELYIEPRKENLRVLLVNTSDAPVEVAGGFLWGDHYPEVNLRLKITGTDGRVYQFRAFVSADPISPSRSRLLYPLEILGRDIPLEFLRSEYSLDPGKYRVRATYTQGSPDARKPALTLQSNEVVLEIRK